MAESDGKEKGSEKVKKDSSRSQTVGEFVGKSLYNTDSLMRSVSVIIQEMTILIPILIIVLIAFLGALTWATVQSGAIPIGINMGITEMLGMTDIPAQIDMPREFTTTINLLGRWDVMGLTIGF